MSYRQAFNPMDDLEVSLGKLNITSGSRTYRIPSPTTRNHPGIAGNSFQSMESQNDNDAEPEKGFYISFDNATAPKRPKPPLRTKRSPKKPSDEFNNIQPEVKEVATKKSYEVQDSYKPPQSVRLSNDYDRPRQSVGSDYERPRQSVGPKDSSAHALIIDDNEAASDPVSENLVELICYKLCSFSDHCGRNGKKKGENHVAFTATTSAARRDQSAQGN
jgi:hypothetical protein